jgi:general secretion pathway protein N
MTRGRRIATGLAAAAGMLLVVVLALVIGVGRGYSLADLDDADVPPPVEVSLTGEMPRMPGAATYADVLVRPLFNESRKPEALPDAGAASEAAPSAPLNVSISGIIITPEASIALVTNNANQQTERVRVGQPLGGDQSAWTLSELRPRAAVFDGGSLGRQEIELSTDTAGMPATGGVAVQPPTGDPAADAQRAAGMGTALPAAMAIPTPSGKVDEQGVQAAQPTQPAPTGNPTEEEIRQRIEERRRQLREEAQRIMQQQQTPPGG